MKFFVHYKIVWNTNHIPIFLCGWHMLKTWRLQFMEKIKTMEMKHVILDYLHSMMFISINLKETIESFEACGGEKNDGKF